MFGNVAISQAPFSSFAGTVYTAAVSEFVSGADAVSGDQSYGALVSDVVTVSDVYSARLPITVNVNAEAVSGVDSYTTQAAIVSTASETAQALDVQVTAGAVNSSMSELVVARDTQTTNFSVLSSRAESVVALDTQRGLPVLPVRVTATASAQDVVASVPNYRTVYADTASAADALNTSFSVVAFAAALAVARDTTAIQTAFLVSNSEATRATMRANGRVNFAVRLSDNATIFDRPEVRRLWEPIPDAQDPNWVTIPTTPT